MIFMIRNKKFKRDLFENLLSEKMNYLKLVKHFRYNLSFLKIEIYLKISKLFTRMIVLKKVFFYLPQLGIIQKSSKPKYFFPSQYVCTTPERFEKYCEIIFPWLKNVMITVLKTIFTADTILDYQLF